MLSIFAEALLIAARMQPLRREEPGRDGRRRETDKR
jgi:hypothetical protein